jgi:hypothetical protein
VRADRLRRQQRDRDQQHVSKGLQDPGVAVVEQVGNQHRADRRQSRQQLRSPAARENERVQRNGRREHRHGPGGAVDVEQHRHQRAGYRQRGGGPAAPSPQRCRGGQAERNRSGPAAVAAMQQLAHDDHRADQRRHGGIDEGFVATVHPGANLASARTSPIPQRE